MTIEAWARDAEQAADLSSALRRAAVDGSGLRRLRMTANGKNGRNGRKRQERPNGHGNGSNAGEQPPAPPPPRPPPPRPCAVAPLHPRLVLASFWAELTVLVAAAFTRRAGFKNRCSLASLRPVSIGQNSFVYAADNTVLGAIPAEKNRRRSRSTDVPAPRAGDRRHRGPALLLALGHRLRGASCARPPRTSRAARSSRAARPSPSSSSATLHRNEVSWERRPRRPAGEQALDEEGQLFSGARSLP